MPRQRRIFTAELKLQMVKLYVNGKSGADIARNDKSDNLDNICISKSIIGSFIMQYT
ncbi:transposase [Bacillus sp. JJ722]|uniref:transposase n=1 Tax=Bacillus sp. JJ722 TaxID=3122973 RepID=UPI002FFF37CB